MSTGRSVEDVGRLTLETNDAEFVTAIKAEEKALAELQRQFQSGVISFAEFDKASDKCVADLAELRAMQERAAVAARELAAAEAAAAAEMNVYAAAAGKTTVAVAAAGKAATAAKGGIGGLQQQITAGSYALQDFTATSGDLGAKLNSVSNNLPMLLSGFGHVGTAIAVAATAGIALYRNWETLTRAFEDKNPFPKAAETVDSLRTQLEKAKKEMEKLEENTSLTAGEMAKYVGLRQTVAETEAKITKEQERQAELKKLGEMKAPEVIEEEKTRKETLALLGGQQDELIRGVAADLDSMNQARREALEKTYQKLTTQLGESSQEERGFLLTQLARTKAEMAAVPAAEAVMPAAKDIVAKALVSGDLAAYQKLRGAAISRPEKFGEETREIIEAASPEKIQEAIEEEVQERLDTERLEAGKRRRERARALRPESMSPMADAAAAAADARLANERAAAEREAAAARPRITAQLARENALFAARADVEAAESDLARLTATGAVIGRGKKARAASQDELREMVRQRAAARLPRGLGEEERFDLSTAITAKAQGRLTKEMGGNLANTQGLINLSQTLLGEVERIRQITGHQAVEIGQLRRRAKAGARTAMPRTQ